MSALLPTAGQIGSFYATSVEAWLEAWSPLAPRRQVESVCRAFYRWPREARPWERISGPSLARGLREALEELAQSAPPAGLPIVLERRESACGTEKLLLRLGPQADVETVLIPNARGSHSRRAMQERLHPDARRDVGRRPERASGCISTQVGCAVGCRFCASGLEGLARNLRPEQIVAQALWLRERAQARGLHLGNLVFMGMGEPLHNLRAVQTALQNLAHPCGAGLGENHLTVSTIGVPRGLDALEREGPRVNLALSLHSPCDALRRELVPLASELPPVEELCARAAAYTRATRRQVTISYVLLGGVNDSPALARDLAALLARTHPFHVNLIPYNAVPELPYRAPDEEGVHAFYSVLRDAGLPVHVRTTRGAPEEAACGQLRRSPR